MRPATMVAALLVAAAGCLDDPAPQGPGPCDGPAPHGACPQPAQDRPTGHRVELLGCDVYFIGYAADGSKVEALTPEGYVSPTFAGRADLVGLDSLSCEHAIIDNATTVAGFSLSVVEAVVEAPPDVRSEDDLYAFELVVSSPAVQAIFLEAGLQAVLGDLEASADGSSLHMGFYLDGALLYEHTGLHSQAPSMMLPGASRIHQGTEGRHAWYGFAFDPVGEAAVYAGPLSVHGGAVGATQLNPGPATFVYSAAGAGRAVLTFPSP